MALLVRAFALLLIGVLCIACQPASIPAVATVAGSTATVPRDSGGAQTSIAETASAGMGAIKGQLERYDGTPLKRVVVYAARIEVTGGMRLASVDALADPHVDTDARGSFRIANLKAGDYVLATQSPVGIILPHNRDGKTVTFAVQANRETDLGELAVGYQYPDGE